MPDLTTGDHVRGLLDASPSPFHAVAEHVDVRLPALAIHIGRAGREA